MLRVRIVQLYNNFLFRGIFSICLPSNRKFTNQSFTSSLIYIFFILRCLVIFFFPSKYAVKSMLPLYNPKKTKLFVYLRKLMPMVQHSLLQPRWTWNVAFYLDFAWGNLLDCSSARSILVKNSKKWKMDFSASASYCSVSSFTFSILCVNTPPYSFL